MRISSVGDAALVVHVASNADAGSVATIDLVRVTVDRLRSAPLPGVVDVAAGSGTVTLARAVRTALVAAGITIAPFKSVR
ncbi:MAG: hypothetical protein EBR86_13600 [Planctomycetia bacterium]|nr:hypothetical protein [Planctomycetia bacterium]